jgi:hypothetical protein
MSEEVSLIRLVNLAGPCRRPRRARPGHPAADDTHYQDFLVGEHALGIGGAFTAIADDASAAFYNPAGLALMGRLTISGALSVYGYERRGSTALQHGARRDDFIHETPRPSDQRRARPDSAASRTTGSATTRSRSRP